MALHVEHITKAFGEKTAVDDLSFSMEHSGVFGLIGTNGAGKTTTIRIILGIMKSDAGRAEWDGRPIVRENVRFGYMPEERGIYMKEKVFEQLVYFGMLHRMTKADASAAARRWLESGVYPTRYEIKEPSLHEIFLDRVGGTEEDAKR